MAKLEAKKRKRASSLHKKSAVKQQQPLSKKSKTKK
jgi:hypothetical protein